MNFKKLEIDSAKYRLEILLNESNVKTVMSPHYLNSMYKKYSISAIENIINKTKDIFENGDIVIVKPVGELPIIKAHTGVIYEKEDALIIFSYNIKRKKLSLIGISNIEKSNSHTIKYSYLKFDTQFNVSDEHLINCIYKMSDILSKTS